MTTEEFMLCLAYLVTAQGEKLEEQTKTLQELEAMVDKAMEAYADELSELESSGD